MADCLSVRREIYVAFCIFLTDMQSEFKRINITARVNVYCHKISQVEDKASRDGIRKREDDDDGGEDEVGEENQTLADFPKSLRFLIGGRGSLGQMVDWDKEEEHHKWENQAKDQPHIDQLYVGGWGDLVGDRLVESVDDEHHGDADGGRGLEVLGPEVETTLADEHKAEGGKVGGEEVVLHAAFENQRHLNPRLSLCHLPVEQGKLCGKKTWNVKKSLWREPASFPQDRAGEDLEAEEWQDPQHLLGWPAGSYKPKIGLV